MKMGIVGKYLIVREADQVYESRIRSWGLMKRNARKQEWTGRVSRDLLEKFAAMVNLPPYIQGVLDGMRKTQAAVDLERGLSDPLPLTEYPVKKNLYKHQVRAANMALVTFGIIEPEEVARSEAKRKAEETGDEQRRSDPVPFGA